MTSLAALALYDGEAEITAANINTLLAASNNTVAPYWPGLFASMLKDGRVDKLVFSVGAPAAAPAGAAAAAAGAGTLFILLCVLISFSRLTTSLLHFHSRCCSCQGGEEGGEEAQGRGG